MRRYILFSLIKPNENNQDLKKNASKMYIEVLTYTYIQHITDALCFEYITLNNY